MKPHAYTVTADRVRLRRGARVFLAEGVRARRAGLLRPLVGHPGWDEIREAEAWFWKGEELGLWGPATADVALAVTLNLAGDPLPPREPEEPAPPGSYKPTAAVVEIAGHPLKSGLAPGAAAGNGKKKAAAAGK